MRFIAANTHSSWAATGLGKPRSASAAIEIASIGSVTVTISRDQNVLVHDAFASA
jgi:hypothetical protein